MWIGFSGDQVRYLLIGIILLFLFLVLCGKLEENYKKNKNIFHGFSIFRNTVLMTIYDLLPLIVVLTLGISWYIFK